MGERTTDPEKSTTFQNKGFRVQKVCSETERDKNRKGRPETGSDSVRPSCDRPSLCAGQN